MVPKDAYGVIHFPWAGGQAQATLWQEPVHWTVDIGDTKMSKESLAHIKAWLNEFHDPRKDYRGPSDGAYAVRTINEAAAFYNGEAEFPPAPPEVPGRVY